MSNNTVTPQDLENEIAFEYYALASEAFKHTTSVIGPAHKLLASAHVTPLSCLTICVLHLRNGFTVTGTSACVDPANFDAAKGRVIAREKAIEQLWPLLGFRLKDQLHSRAINATPGGDFGSPREYQAWKPMPHSDD